MVRRITAVVTTFALTTVVAPLPSAGAATDDATFTRKANAACAEAGRKLLRMPVPAGDATGSVFEATAEITSDLVKRLKQIHAPKAKAALYRAFIRSTEKEVRAIDALVDSLEREDGQDVMGLLNRIADAGEHSDALAVRLKLRSCDEGYVGDDTVGT